MYHLIRVWYEKAYNYNLNEDAGVYAIFVFRWHFVFIKKPIKKKLKRKKTVISLRVQALSKELK